MRCAIASIEYFTLLGNEHQNIAAFEGVTAATAVPGVWIRSRRYKGESADKPGSVEDSHSSGTHVTARLERPTREPCGPHVGLMPSLPYLVLLRVGFTLPLPLPATRCALTAPFHPYLDSKKRGGIFSVALSVGSHPPGVTWHLALWSPDFPPPA